MTISSRTPEGTPNRCVLCGLDLKLEPSIDTLDAPCPHCGHLLWFGKAAAGRSDKSSQPVTYEGFLIGVGRERLGPFPSELQQWLFEVVGLLAKEQRLPSREELIGLASRAQSWSDVIRKLQCKSRMGSRPHWAYSAGAFVRRQYKRLFARSQTS